MILQALTEYYEALAAKGEISPPGWCREKVNFLLSLSPEGELLDIIPNQQEVTVGKKTRQIAKICTVPERVSGRTTGIKANFLCDNATYLLGLDTKGNPSRAIKSFASSKELHLTALADVQNGVANAVRAFFTHWDPNEAEQNPLVQKYENELKTANLSFAIGKTHAHEDPDIKQAWEAHKAKGSDTPTATCLVTGKKLPVTRLHASIKGIPGAQTAGAKLISYNASAFVSYGKEDREELCAPISEHAAFAYATALNSLLSGTENRQQVGDTTVVFWAEGAQEKPAQIMSWFLRPEPDVTGYLKGVMEHLAKGKLPDEMDVNTKFYILGLSPNAARISVRFFLQDTFGNFLTNLKVHFDQLQLEGPPNKMELLSAYRLVNETVNQNSTAKKPAPLLVGEVLRSILMGTPYPRTLVQGVLTRIRAEQDNPDRRIYKLTHGRVSIIKAYLMRQSSIKDKEEISVALNETWTNRAYVLGRLFAALERLQQQANPNIQSTIKSTYFTAAGSTPAGVFPRLLQLAEHHMAKLKEKRVWHEKSIGELMGMLEANQQTFPVHFAFDEQSLFILGYYQQRQKYFEKKEKEGV